MLDFSKTLDFDYDNDVVNNKRLKASVSSSRSSVRSSLLGSLSTTSSSSSSSLSSSPFTLGFLSESSSGRDPFTSPESSEPSSLSKQESYVFTPQGFTFVRGKDEGESIGFFVQDATQVQYLVKPFTEGNKADVIREFLGLTVLKEMIALLGSSIITPEFSLQKDEAGKFGLFIKMIPNLVLNNQVNIFSPTATPGKKKRPSSIASYYDLPLMMVLSMLIGDDDCSPDNSGSKGSQGVRIDLGRAFYWLYANDSEFRTKLVSCFTSYKEYVPFCKFSDDFNLLCRHLPKLANPECLLRIQLTLNSAIRALSLFVNEKDLAAITFNNETIEIPQAAAASPLLPSLSGRKITTKTYYSYAQLEESLFEMIKFNLTKVLPGFLQQVGQEIAIAKASQESQSMVLQAVSPSKGNIMAHQQLLASAIRTETLGTGVVITKLENISPNCSPMKPSFSRRLSDSTRITQEISAVGE